MRYIASSEMEKLNFATPLPQSTHSEVLEWQFPGKHKQFVLTGKSRAAWHTSFIVPQLNLLLDAGLCVNHQRPKHIFLTHGHSDHTLLTPAFIKRSDPPDIYCPVEVVKILDDFLVAKTILNLGGVVTAADGVDATDAATVVEDDEFDATDSQPPEPSTSTSTSTDTSTSTNGAAAAAPPKEERSWLQTHHIHGVRPGDTVPLRRTVDFTAEAFACDHTVPCVGYVFKVQKQKLKQQYLGLAGVELKKLREQGVAITAPQSTPVFAFLGDTTAATLAAEPPWLRDGIPVVITECSFLWEEHRDQAVKTKHTIWADLEPVVRRWPRTTFVLTHFSLRYNDDDIRRFFAELRDPPSNIVIWIDGNPDPQFSKP